MPGMSGEDFLGFVKAYRPGTPLVFVSGSTDEELLWLEAQGYLTGCKALTEPTSGRSLVNRLYVKGGLTRSRREALDGHSPDECP